ncbi:MAG: amidohydrolase [Woeseiaceae bacterium]
MFKNIIWVRISCLVLLISACDSSLKQGIDTAFINGGIYNSDESHTWSEALGIDDGLIVIVGSNGEVRELIGNKTNVIDLQDKMLMPSFHDGHAHVSYGGRDKIGCNINGRTSSMSTRQQLNECANNLNLKKDAWLTGGGWELFDFPDGAPSSEMLDEIFGGRPVSLSDAFGHNLWVSSKALELAGINSDTPDPPNGTIVRDLNTGKPSGTLRDSAMNIMLKVLPELTVEQQYKSLLVGIEEANKFGITAFIEPGVDQPLARLYKNLEDNEDLNARVMLALSPIKALPGSVGSELFDLLAERGQYRGRYLNPDSVKIYIDGVIETQTSNMLEPYNDGSNFPPFYNQTELDELFQRLDEMKVQIHTHAIGDGAIRNALDAFEYALLHNGPNDNRHLIVHLQLIDKEDQSRFGELNVAANFQCLWCYPDPYIGFAEDAIGKDRVERFYPVRSLQKVGALLVGGSDWSVTSLNPLEAIETAIRRQDPYTKTGPTLGQNEEVDLYTALDMYTRNAAYVMRLEDKTGTIEVGKRADLIVLDRNLFEIPVTEISEAKVLLTLMDGREVYNLQ